MRQSGHLLRPPLDTATTLRLCPGLLVFKGPGKVSTSIVAVCVPYVNIWPVCLYPFGLFKDRPNINSGTRLEQSVRSGTLSTGCLLIRLAVSVSLSLWSFHTANLMDSRYKFPMLCSSLHTTTIIQLIIFVLFNARALIPSVFWGVK